MDTQHYTKIPDLVLKTFINDCLFIVNNFSNGSFRHHLYYKDDYIKILKEEDEKLTITVFYEKNGIVISNPAINIWNDGKLIRAAQDWRKLEHYPKQLINQLTLSKKLEHNLTINPDLPKNKL